MKIITNELLNGGVNMKCPYCNSKIKKGLYKRMMEFIGYRKSTGHLVDDMGCINRRSGLACGFLCEWIIA